MIRDDLCYQNLPVTIVGMGAGTIYSNLGGTHMTQEDVSIAKSIPNMSVISPVDLRTFCSGGFLLNKINGSCIFENR